MFGSLACAQVTELNTAPIFSLWAQRGPTQDWRCLATSADGMKLVAGASSGPIQLSTDGGVTWTDGPVSGAWSSVACSWDGNHLVATTSSALGSSRLLTSADGGETWTVRDDQHEWSKVAMSANGDIVFALGDGQIFTSLQYGANIALCNDVFTFTSIACNASGSQVVACADNEQLQLSQNYGTDWLAVESARHWSGVACSADGMTLAAADLGSGEGNDGQVYVSSTSGFIWSPTGPGRSWTQVVCSTDGMRMAALANNQIYFSPDGGLNWLLQSANDASWAFVAINATGSQVFAGGVPARFFVGSSDVLDGISVTSAQSFTRPNFVKHIAPGTQASEADQTVTFTADPDHPEFFVIQPAISNDGTLTFTPVAEAFGTVTVNVTAHDDGGTENGGVDTSEPQRFLIHLGNNHAPYGVSLSGSHSVLIGSSNVTVGTLSALDIDIGDTHAFSFAIGSGAEDNGLFSIANGNELVLTTEAMYRAEPYRIRVVATDSSEQSYEQTFAISVFVFNHAPTLMLAADRVAVETNVGPVARPNFVSAVTTGDNWQFLDSISYLISNDNNALFSIQPTIASDGTLTFTPAEDTSGSAIVTVRAQDTGGTANGGQDTSEPRTFTIIVRNNTAPTDITLSTTTIPENNLPGAIIAHITATDSDEGEVFSYVLVAGQGDTDNADFIVKGDALKLKGTANFETRSTFAIRLQVTDELGATYQKSFVLAIMDNNDPPSFTIPTSNGIVGETWTAHDQNRNWSGVASSADGFKLAAVEYDGNIHTSTDGGLTWVEHEVDTGIGGPNPFELPPSSSVEHPGIASLRLLTAVILSRV